MQTAETSQIMSIPSLTKLTTGRHITQDDAAMPVRLAEFVDNQSIIFELRAPFMNLIDETNTSILDEQNMVDVGFEFLKLSYPVKGFLGWDKTNSAMTCIYAEQTPYDPNGTGPVVMTMLPYLTKKLILMCAELVGIAKKGGLIPEGRSIDGNLIRFDTQHRTIAQPVSSETRIDRWEGLHSDSMSVHPRTFATEQADVVDNSLNTVSNSTREGIAVLFYLRAETSWSGTELCLPYEKGGGHPTEKVVIFKPTSGDVVIINDTTLHGVCNATHLGGATAEGDKRILLRITMPYDV